MSDFEKVSDELRDLPGNHGSGPGPRTRALMDGETIFVPLNGRSGWNVQNSSRNSLRPHGYRLRVRTTTKDGVVGLVMWAEKKVPA